MTPDSYLRPDKPVLVIAGPTASGKTSTALILCEHLGGEIVSADSMQIYLGMDIGTAKSTPEERAVIPHHLLDIRKPGDRFSVADYKIAATAAIKDIYRRGAQPVVCGGTGQYLSALIEGLTFTENPTDLVLRKKLNDEANFVGLAVLYDRLCKLDPETAGRIAATDQKRIIRALEVYMQTGRTISLQNQESREKGPDFCYQSYCLSHDRPILYERINQRVIQMIGAGLDKEVQALLDMDLPSDSTCLQAIGYKEMIPYLNGQISLAETISSIQQATRRYAKRQLTWFRKMPDLNWLFNQEPEQNARIILENR